MKTAELIDKPCGVDLKIESEGTPTAIINMAIANGADLSRIEKLLELKERWDVTQAKKLFSHAFAGAQKDIEAVAKTATNPQTHSKYAKLEGIIESAKPVYTKYGFAVVFYEGTTEKSEHIRICADVLHEMGHKETYYYDVPLDGKGIKGNANMTNIHAKASSTSYARRYLMCMIWNIPTADDDDGNGGKPAGLINDDQLMAIRTTLKEMGDERQESALVKYLKVEKLEDLPASEYRKAMAVLEARKAQKAVTK